ncbi:MAG: hypothetical protein RL430_1673, partial [Actinomycetota bacterium]
AARGSARHRGRVPGHRASLAHVGARRYFHAARTCKLYDFEAATWLPYSSALAK